jgi:hypothetical protein
MKYMHKFEDILLDFGLTYDEDYYWFVNQEERVRGEYICSLYPESVCIATEVEFNNANKITYYGFQNFYTKDAVKNKLIEILKLRKEKIILDKKLNIEKDFQ